MTVDEVDSNVRVSLGFRWIAVASLLLELCYICAVRAGTPSDETSHFDTVRFYSTHLRMPILGQPGVSYEAQMGPLFYTIAAMLYNAFVPLGPQFAFFALRVCGAFLMLPLLMLTRRIATRVLPAEPELVTLAVAFTAFNPSLLAIGGSVQNDILTIVLSMWVMDLTLRWIADSKLNWGRGTMLGIICGLAILTKSSALYLVPSVIVLVVLSRRVGRLRFATTFAAVVSILTTWWFVRNWVLYGDATAQKGLRDHGYTNAPPPVSIYSPHQIAHWVWQIVAYFWFPTEYYRMLFHANLWLQAIAGVVMAIAAYGWFRILHNRNLAGLVDRSASRFLIICLGSAFSIYSISCFRFTFFAARTLFPTFVCWALVISVGLGIAGRGTKRIRSTFVFSATVTLMLILNFCMLTHVVALPVYPFNLFCDPSGSDSI